MSIRLRREAGFSLLEALIVVAVMLVLAGFAIIQSFGSMQSYRANAAMDTIISQLRVARQMAISQRRNVQITFSTGSSPQSITYTVRADPGDTIVPAPVTVPLNPMVMFTSVPSETDTPMQFGTCGGAFGVCIGQGAQGASVSNGPPSGMFFTSTGQFTDSTFNSPMNGTVFLAIQGEVPTARAVTIMGGTGRIRSYTWVGGSTSWTE